MTDAAALDAEFGMQAPEFASRRTLVLRRFLRRPSAVAALVVLLALFIGCYTAPSLVPYSYSDLDFNALLQPPNARHWLGTNALGQDLLAQTLRGMQKSMLIAVCVAFISTGIAATVGSISGYFGGWRDRALMWFVDLMLVVPGFLLIMILTPRTKSSGNVIVLVLLLAGFGWMVSSRMVRGMTMSLREREFVVEISPPRVAPLAQVYNRCGGLIGAPANGQGNRIRQLAAVRPPVGVSGGAQPVDHRTQQRAG